MQYYAAKLSEHMAETPEGYLVCYDVPINRTGTQEYFPQEIGMNGTEKLVVERLPEDVFSPETLASFEGKPVTYGHPTEAVDSGNYSFYSKGHVQNVRREGDTTVADLLIQDPTLIELIKDGTVREISCGYRCDFIEDGGRIRQKNILGNHVAVVPQGRAGASVAIKDAKPKKERGQTMSKKKSFLKTFFQVYDELPDEAEEREEAEKTMEKKEEMADEMVEKAPKGDDLGSKLDAVLSKLDSFGKRLDALESKNGEEEKRLSDERDIERYIEENPEETEKIRILRKMQPSIAELKDACGKAKVTDALLSCFTPSYSAGDVLRGTEKKAREMRDARPSQEAILQTQKQEYDARNPHKRKEC